MMHWFGDGSYGMGHGIGWIFIILFWALIIYLVVRGTGRWSGKGTGPGPQKSAEEILKERYAKGEINKEEFERMKRDLRG
jgi:putative membrane protein